MFLSKNGISRSAKQFHEVDLDLWGRIATFFFQAVFYQNFDVFVILRSAKQFCKVDLDLWGQNATFFILTFFVKNLMFSSKNIILHSAKQFNEVDLDS
jgi:hypothetical protein